MNVKLLITMEFVYQYNMNIVVDMEGKKCPSEGYECVDDPRDNCTPECGGADCIGICVKTFIDKEGNGANCGGKMGSMCPEGFKCFDDDSDTCNPQCGGADCLGFCADPVRKENVV
eukprot:23255_1